MTLVQKADRLWSRVIRQRDVTCRRCARGDYLQAAHILSRSFMATRWDLRNGITLCLFCHRWAHAEPNAFRTWIKNRLGATYDDIRHEALAYSARVTPVDVKQVIAELEKRVAA